MIPEFTLEITSPPELEYLAVEIWLGDEQLGELSREQEEPILELYPRSDGEPWRVSVEEFMEVLTKAYREIMSHQRPSQGL